MRQQTVIYVLVLIVGAAGLWAVLRIGNRLQAAADLGGTWRFESGPLGTNSDGSGSLGEGFDIDQSGRFFRIQFASGRRLDLRARQLPHGTIGPEPVDVDLANDRWQLKGSVRQEGGRLIGAFKLAGPQGAQFVAYRDPPEAADSPPPVELELPAAVLPTTQATTGRPMLRLDQPVADSNSQITP